MKRKNLLLFAFGLATTIAVVVPHQAAAGCHCALPVYTTEPTTGIWGLGSDCTAAHNDLIATLNSLIDCEESPCSITFVQKTACFEKAPGMWREDGVYEYRCIVCIERDPPPGN